MHLAFITSCRALLTTGFCLAMASLAAGAPARSPWAGFVETDYPFFSSVVDARAWESNNLTPRGLVLNLGHNCWATFDVDLLRVSAVWFGIGLSPDSMAQGSYHTAGHKVAEGQTTLPVAMGQWWLVNGIYPGWQASEAVSLKDPRPPGPDAREVGRGAIPGSNRFRALRLVDGGCRLEYEIAGAMIREQWHVSSPAQDPHIRRHLSCDPLPVPCWLVVGTPNAHNSHCWLEDAPNDVRLQRREDGLLLVRVPAAATNIGLTIVVARHPHDDAPSVQRPQSPPAPSAGSGRAPRWPQTLTTSGHVAANAEAFVVDNIDLPLDNPWKRNVRLADLAFFRDGRAAGVTFDGDVWLIDGLAGDLQSIRWRRFASGLHEPLSLAVHNEQIVVFDRNGLWRLRDTNDDQEADVHELISNAFTQTAETREFATGMRVGRDGSYIVSKGGQQTTTIGQHNGTVLRVPADGAPAEVLAYGLRMPFIGVHPKSGLITASDQQGHYVPTTPLHIIRGHQFYGFISLLLPKEKYPAPIADPLTWIPHPVNASGASQVWLTGARMGPLNDALIHIGYYRPELFVVRLSERTTRTQAAVISLTRDLAFPPLNGAVNPVDGQLYVTGFQIWGTEARQTSGLARVRHTGQEFTMPREIVPMREGVLLRCDVPFEAASATNLANYSAECWNYRRTVAYGSPHFKLDGSKGHDTLPPSSAYLSADARTVFIGIPDMRPAMQMRLGWTLRTQAGAAASHNAYFTPSELPPFDPVKEGFAPLSVNLTPRPPGAQADTPITATEGRRVAELMGCVACHSTDGTTLGKVGPTWKGMFGRSRAFADGSKAVADEAYLRESIREPNARILAGFDKSDAGMPSYEGVITDAQIEALVEYLKTVK